VNENDNNKNQTHTTVDNWVRETYAKDSKATLKNALSDPYVKAIKWASERVKNEGIVAFVTNNSFLEGIAFDGMRKHLAQDFSKIYILDLGGNVRKNPKLSGTTHNVFGIQVGVSINLLLKKKSAETTQIFYASLDEYWRKENKYNFLDKQPHNFDIDWQLIKPNKKHTWLTEGLHEEFDEFIPLGTKAAKAEKGITEEVIFNIYSRGVSTSRDAWAYNFNQQVLEQNMQSTITFYNQQVEQWINNKDTEFDDFIVYDESKLSWDGTLKGDLKKGKVATFSQKKVRISLYRPFTKKYLFFDRALNNSIYLFPKIFPTPETEAENRVICLAGIGDRKGFGCLVTNLIPSLDLAFEKTQCFPFYTYNEEGTNRTENITDWALSHWQQYYQDQTITKWAIFHYVYALLHHPHYREKYAHNLKKELPRLPLAPKFWDFAHAGEQLANLHLNYEQAEPYPLEEIENPKYPFSLEVEKMRLSKDKTQLIYNNFLTLKGIPKQTFDYKLGNRSALDWIIDQYRIKTDKRSGIVNNPNRKEDEYYIIELIKKIITVSLETQHIVEEILKYSVMLSPK
jgi:predicted helicase